MEGMSQELPTYEWQSPAAQQLAELNCVSQNLGDCRRFLRQMVETKASDLDEPLMSAALIRYRRAFTGGIRKGFTADDIRSLGDRAAALHERITLAAAEHIDRREKPRVGIIAGDRIERIKLLSAHAIHWDEQSIEQWIALIDLIESRIVRPQSVPLEAAVLKEAQIFGIQLVRHLPVLDSDIQGTR